MTTKNPSNIQCKTMRGLQRLVVHDQPSCSQSQNLTALHYSQLFIHYRSLPALDSTTRHSLQKDPHIPVINPNPPVKGQRYEDETNFCQQTTKRRDALFTYSHVSFTHPSFRGAGPGRAGVRGRTARTAHEHSPRPANSAAANAEQPGRLVAGGGSQRTDLN